MPLGDRGGGIRPLNAEDLVGDPAEAFINAPPLGGARIPRAAVTSRPIATRPCAKTPGARGRARLPSASLANCESIAMSAPEW